ncbi:MAG: CHAT domain-containing tetratricopeptide repeat protein [Blastocatellia bacterium]
MERLLAEAASLKAMPDLRKKKHAIELLEDSLNAEHSLNDAPAEIRMLMLLGEIQAEISNFEQSACACGHALQHARELGDEAVLAETLNAVALASIRLNRLEEARKYGQEAMRICERNQDSVGKARALANEGEWHYTCGDSDQAVEKYSEAMRILQPLNLPKQLAEMQMCLGMLYTDRHDTKNAFDYLNKAAKTFESIGDVRGNALTLIGIAHLNAKIGESHEALALYDQTLKTVKAIGDRYWEASILNGIGFVHQFSGERKHAFIRYDQAREIFRKLGLKNEEAQASLAAAIIMDDQKLAFACFEDLLKTSQELEVKQIEAVSWRELGAIHGELGNRMAAMTAYARARELFNSTKTVRGEIETLIRHGGTQAKFNLWPEAKRSYLSALALSREKKNQDGERESLFQLARMAKEAGRLDEARSHIESAIEIAETQRINVGVQGLQSSYFASIQKYFKFSIDLLMSQSEKGGNGSLQAQAFEQSERARARSLLDALGRAHADLLLWGDPALIAQLREIRQKINRSSKSWFQRKGEGAEERELMNLSLETTSLLIERDQIEARIRAAAPRERSSKHPQPSTLPEIQKLLDEDTLLLEYSLNEKRSYVWVITPTAIEAATLSGRREIEEAARDLFPELSTEPFQSGLSPEETEKRYWKKAAALSRLILGPIANKLRGKKLLVVADGLLQRIPFQALPIPGDMARAGFADPQPPQPMMLRHRIVNLPSASALVTLRQKHETRRPPAKPIAVFADAVFERDDVRVYQDPGSDSSKLPASSSTSQIPSPVPAQERLMNLRRLHFTGEEAKAIENALSIREHLKTGPEATREAVLDPRLKDYRYLHFATHGDLNDDQPELSALIFSLYDRRGRRLDGSVYLHEIYNLDLNADLVVLSACETARGREISGEGVIGLTRGFMYAGSRQVMASLWSVEDDSTSQLMKHFYWNLFKRGERPIEALQHAQMALWQTPATRAPYFWAGFVLQGEYQ